MSESGPSIAVHSNPIWRERSNFIVRAALPENGSGRSFEQLWARRLTENTFELCCIPFFLYELSLGDIVSWIEGTYHRRRRQRVLGRLTPIEFETIMNTSTAIAA